MIDANFAYAFTAGMVATVNPCGFAMLPAYLGYFLGIQGDDATETTAGMVRALVVGAVVSAGFLVIFAGAGLLVSWGSVSVGQWSPWLTVVIGVVLVAVGLGLALGWEPKVLLPRLDKGGRDRGLWSMFLFGVSYAIASLSCTLPVFSSVVASTFSRDSFVSGVATFVAYAAGMALLLTVLTVTLALARRGLVTGLRRALPYVQRASGAIMALMGAYLTWYGIYEIRVQRNGPTDGSGPFDLVNRWSSSASDSLAKVDPLQAALGLALVVAVVVLVALLRSPRPTEPHDAPEA
ncbi:cytochrome c biogenesis CcdA family protein [Aquihabitans sp. G128]|uniref:cytochrome c biogenesis CcdA family protein n=1 Tax=Aquihabitans sp. G128 TaxID=2849779 RepID=UPI001C219EE1|nr:cytochrome c biogenesis CcdA family protein [Aquihabitans sp. G128]QXC59469.1 cytochrome c biogenesis CcdA family protein [Aquihabitans sp. G128]